MDWITGSATKLDDKRAACLMDFAVDIQCNASLYAARVRRLVDQTKR